MATDATIAAPATSCRGFVYDFVLYRFWDADGRLLYIGITSASMRVRFRWHSLHQPWWPEVASCKVEFLPSREKLAEAERLAIRRERPRYNVVHQKQPLQLTDDEWLWLCTADGSSDDNPGERGDQ